MSMMDPYLNSIDLSLYRGYVANGITDMRPLRFSVPFRVASGYWSIPSNTIHTKSVGRIGWEPIRCDLQVGYPISNRHEEAVFFIVVITVIAH